MELKLTEVASKNRVDRKFIGNWQSLVGSKNPIIYYPLTNYQLQSDS